MANDQEVDTTFTCDLCERELPISKVGVTNTGPDGYFILCQTCVEFEKTLARLQKFLNNTKKE